MVHVPVTGHPVADTALAVILGIGLGVLVLAGVVWAGWAKVSPILKRIEKSVKETAEQTTNDHKNAEFPNLRDNLDALFSEVRTQGGVQRALVQDLARIQKDIGGLRKEIRDDREAQRETANALAEHIRDKSQMEPRLAKVEHQLEQHRQATET